MTTASLVLVDAAGNPRVSLTGLKWAWWDSITPNLFTAPTDKGTGQTTDGSGHFSVTLVSSTKTAGQTGWLLVSNSDGTSTQNPPHKAFSGPVVVS